MNICNISVQMEIIEVETRLEGTDTQYYSKAADYWAEVTPTIEGMLGRKWQLKQGGIQVDHRLQNIFSDFVISILTRSSHRSIISDRRNQTSFVTS